MLYDKDYIETYCIGKKFAELLGELVDIKSQTLDTASQTAFFDGLRDNLILDID